MLNNDRLTAPGQLPYQVTARSPRGRLTGGALEEAAVALRIETVTIDALNPQALARFWSAALGWEHRVDEDGDVWVGPGRGDPDRGSVRPLLFLAVPELKSVKNRIHLDLRPDDQADEVERLEDLGATRVSVGQSGTEGWVVLADPEGNEFCVLSDT
jgi:predicted enzyme related to lactoylglutathione lyase